MKWHHFKNLFTMGTTDHPGSGVCSGHSDLPFVQQGCVQSFPRIYLGIKSRFGHLGCREIFFKARQNCKLIFEHEKAQQMSSSDDKCMYIPSDTGRACLSLPEIQEHLENISMNPPLFKTGLKAPSQEKGRTQHLFQCTQIPEPRVSNRMQRRFLALIPNKRAGKVCNYLSSSLTAKHSRDLQRQGLITGFSERKHRVHKQEGF